MGQSPMRIAFLTPWKVDDPASWSGVVKRMHEALSERTPTQTIETGHLGASIVDRAASKILGQVSSKQYLTGHALATGRRVGRYVTDAMRRSSADVVLAVAASQEVAFADIRQPVVHVTDATFASMLGYYPLFTSLHPLSVWQGTHMAKRAQLSCTAFSVATHWARDSLISDYGVQPAACEVIPFGPRMESVSVPHRQPGPGLRVLVVASDWQRKGGDKALAAVDAVRGDFPQTSLTVVGHAPRLPDWVRTVGRVPAHELADLYESHDVLLELAEANAGGVTLTDAHAFGLPVIATNTGGVSSIVADRASGILVAPGAGGGREAVNALRAMQDPGFRLTLATSAYHRYRNLLNWDRWAEATLRMCETAALRATQRAAGDEFCP